VSGGISNANRGVTTVGGSLSASPGIVRY